MFVQARPFPQALQACSLKAAKLFSSVTAHEPPCSWRNIWAQLDQSTSDEAKEPDASSRMWQAALPVAFRPNTRDKASPAITYTAHCDGCPWRVGTVKM